jgi:hypothetical protein
LTILTSLPWTSWLGIETRTEFLFNLFEGEYFAECFGVLLVALFTFTILKWKGLISIIPLICIAFFFYLNLFIGLFSRPIIWEDKVLYSQIDGESLILIQHYWFGITGDHPVYRAILTNNKSINNDIRRIEILHDSIVPKCLSSDAWLFPVDSLPKEIEFQNNKYILKKTFSKR